MNIKQKIEEYKEEYLKDLAQLVAIPSVRDLDSKESMAPFGKNIMDVFDVFIKIAKRCGFQTFNDEGYACYACLGELEADYIGVLGHLDVVESLNPTLWDSDPFVMSEKNGVLYGRGVNDDKGPLLAALYAMRIIQDLKLPLKYSIRIIAGGAEETTWECMDHYFKNNSQPIMGFSPDGNFPIVNGEKGILQFQAIFKKDKQNEFNDILSVYCPNHINFVCDEIELKIHNPQLTEQGCFTGRIEDDEVFSIVYKGKKSLSRNPQKGENALWRLAKDATHISFAQKGMNQLLTYLNTYFVDDFYGEKANIYFEDKQMGVTSICPMSITETENEYILSMDYRYHKGVDINQIKTLLENQVQQFGGEFRILQEKKLLFVDEQSKLIQSLKKAYKQVMLEEAQVLTKGGASYARVLDHGVAFGATFENEDPCPHMPNEHMSIESLMKACEIYVYALIELACYSE